MEQALASVGAAVRVVVLYWTVYSLPVMYTWRGPALGGPGRYLFCVTRVPGRIMRPCNVLNDRPLAPSAGFIQNKRQVVRADVN